MQLMGPHRSKKETCFSQELQHYEDSISEIVHSCTLALPRSDMLRLSQIPACQGTCFLRNRASKTNHLADSYTKLHLSYGV